MDKEDFTKQLKGILRDFDLILSKSIYEDLSNIQTEKLAEIITRSKAAVSRITGKNSEYYQDVVAIINKPVNYGLKLRAVIGVIKGLLLDLENNYTISMGEIIHADVFSDFIEMAEYLSLKQYKDASAVIIGSTLESHIRNLCIKNNININEEVEEEKTHKKADKMNSELRKKEIYNLAYQKQITAWLDIRNNAAHGKYDQYSQEQVKLMIEGVRNFIINYPA